ncbi:MAG: DUF1697 domain-containing protein [Bacteroidales bacterium]
MKTYIMLLRGINVGGRNTIPMRELTGILEDLGCSSVKTYIQSGNIVLRSDMDADSLSELAGQAIQSLKGFEPHVLVLERRDLERAIAANPFPEAESDPKGLHLGFLDAPPSSPDLDTLESMKAKSERFQLIENIFYLHAPEGVGRSKLATNTERSLGVPMTDRNWRTISKIRDLAEEVDE